MIQEDKQLLLKDLCARLPYGVYCQIRYKCKNKIIEECKQLDGVFLNDTECLFRSESGAEYSSDYKPYLRPMSSMTEDEREEIEVFIFNEWYQENSCKIDNEGWIEILANYDVSGIDPCFCSDYVDWLNEHHFDYRGLIPMGLALEAPKDMYKTE